MAKFTVVNAEFNPFTIEADKFYIEDGYLFFVKNTEQVAVFKQWDLVERMLKGKSD